METFHQSHDSSHRTKQTFTDIDGQTDRQTDEHDELTWCEVRETHDVDVAVL